MFWAHEPNRPVASPNSRSTPATPSPAKCSRKRLKGRRVACSWRPCARSRPTIAERCRRVVCRSVAPLPSKADARASPLLLPRARLRPPLLCCRPRLRPRRCLASAPWCAALLPHCPRSRSARASELRVRTGAGQAPSSAHAPPRRSSAASQRDMRICSVHRIAPLSPPRQRADGPRAA